MQNLDFNKKKKIYFVVHVQLFCLYLSIIPYFMSLFVYIVYIIVTVYCLLSSVLSPYSPRQIPPWYKILLGNKSVPDSDSDSYSKIQ